MLLLLAAIPVRAEDPAYDANLFLGGGFYLSAGLAAGEYLEIEDDFEDDLGGPSVKVDETIGVDLRAGYRIHRNLAAEVQFQWLSDVKVKAAGIKLLEVETWTLTGNLKVYALTDRIAAVLMGGRVQPFLLAGVGLMHFDIGDPLVPLTDDDGQDLAARFGAGIDFYATKEIGFCFDVTYLIATGDVDGLDHVGLSLGAIYRF